MKTRAPRLFLSVFLLLFLSAAAPQRTDIPTLGETIEVSLVNVDVVVTDKDGKRGTLVPENGASAGAFSVYVVAGGIDQNLSDVARQTQRFEIPRRDPDKALASHFTYDLEVVLRNNTDRLAIGVVDEVSKSYAVLRLPVEKKEAR